MQRIQRTQLGLRSTQRTGTVRNGVGTTVHCVLPLVLKPVDYPTQSLVVSQCDTSQCSLKENIVAVVLPVSATIASAENNSTRA
jgi:hypothetical protein